MSNRFSRLVFAALVANVVFAAPTAAQMWTSAAATGNWSDPTNWNGGAGPAPVSDPATALIFSGTAASYIATNDIGVASFTLNSLTVTNTGSTTIAGLAAANTLTFAGAGANLTVSAGDATVSTGLAYGTGQTVNITNNGNGALTITDGRTYSGTNVTLNFANTGAGSFAIPNMAQVSGTVNIVAGSVGFAGDTGGDLFGGNLVLNVASGATFNFASNGETMGGITGAGTIVQGTAGITMTLPGDRGFSGGIIGSGGLSQNNNGVFTLSGSGLNSFTGNTTIAAGGTIRLGADNALSSGSLVVLNSANGPGTLDLNGFSATTAGLAGGFSTTTVAIGVGATLTLNPIAVQTFNGAFTGAGALTIGGPGTEVVLGTSNFTGPTTITGGTLRIPAAGLAASSTITVTSPGVLDLAQSADAAFTRPVAGNGTVIKSGAGNMTLAAASQFASIGTLQIGAGTVTLDFTADNGAKVNSGATLALGSGALALLGNANTTSKQSFAATNLIGGGRVAVTTGANQNATIDLGSINHNPGTALNVALTNTGTGTAAVTTTTPNGTAGNPVILGGWATVNGTDWAVAGDGSAAAPITALPAASYVANTWASGNHTSVTATGAQSGATTASLRFNNTATTTLTLTGLNTLETGGILVPSTTSAAVTIAAATAGGTLVAPNGQDIVINQFGSGNLTISADFSATAVVKTGPGLLTLTAPAVARTFTGTYYLDGGTLSVGAPAILGPTAAGGTPTIQFNGGTLRITATHNPGSASQPWTFGPGGGTVEVTGAISATKQGNSVFGAGPLTKTGTGMLTIGSNASTFSGFVTVTQGTLRFTSNQFKSAAGMTINTGGQYQINDNAVGTFNFATGAVLTLNGTGPSNNGAFAVTEQAGGGPVTTFPNAIVLQTDSMFSPTNGPDLATLILTGPITGPGNLIVNGTGALQITSAFNTYGGAAGTTTVLNGALQLAGGADRLPTTTTLMVDAGATTAGVIDLNGNNQTVAGLLKTGAGTGAGVGNSNATTSATLTVNYNGVATQSYGGLLGGTVGTIVANNLKLVKAGSGAFSLTGANTYSQGTTLSNGTLLLNNGTVGSATGSGSITTAVNTILGGTGTALPAAGNTVMVNGAIAPGNSIGTLTFGSDGTPTIVNLRGEYQAEIGAGSSADLIAVPSGTLDITGASLTISGTPSGSDYTLATFGTLIGTFGTSISGLPTGYQLLYQTNSIVLAASPVPEPAAVLCVCAAVAGLVGWRRRRAAKS
jgi:fibronectin-binding autotransporter adhesin